MSRNINNFDLQNLQTIQSEEDISDNDQKDTEEIDNPLEFI